MSSVLIIVLFERTTGIKEYVWISFEGYGGYDG